jgi:SAM-dependent methyltransferase
LVLNFLSMAEASALFGGEISRRYEDYLGEFIFEPFAVDLAARIDWTGVGRVLELACGSGRLTARIVERAPADVAIMATDISDDMLRVAGDRVSDDRGSDDRVPGDRVPGDRVSDDWATADRVTGDRVTGGRITWRVADMLALPFDSASFDLVVCQFGIMIVPDVPLALAEIFRVLRIGGRVVFSAWTDLAYNRLWALGDDVLLESIGKSPMKADPGPFALGDEVFVTGLLESAGFTGVSVAEVVVTGESPSAEKAAFGFIYGLPVCSFVQKENAGALPAILRTLEERLVAELGDQPLRVPQKALVYGATK